MLKYNRKYKNRNGIRLRSRSLSWYFGLLWRLLEHFLTPAVIRCPWCMDPGDTTTQIWVKMGFSHLYVPLLHGTIGSWTLFEITSTERFRNNLWWVTSSCSMFCSSLFRYLHRYTIRWNRVILIRPSGCIVDGIRTHYMNLGPCIGRTLGTPWTWGHAFKIANEMRYRSHM